MVAISPAFGRVQPSIALDQQPVRAFFNNSAHPVQFGSHRQQPVRFFDPQFLRTLDQRFAGSIQGSNHQNRNFIDQSGNQFPADGYPPQSCRSDPQIRDWLFTAQTFVQQLDIGSHLAQHIKQSRAGRINADIGQGELAIRNDRRRH